MKVINTISKSLTSNLSDMNKFHSIEVVNSVDNKFDHQNIELESKVFVIYCLNDKNQSLKKSVILIDMYNKIFHLIVFILSSHFINAKSSKHCQHETLSNDNGSTNALGSG